MSQPIAEVEQEALAALESAKDAESLQQWKSKYLGNKGAVRALLSQIGGLPAEERAGFGQGVNALKVKLTELFDATEVVGLLGKSAGTTPSAVLAEGVAKCRGLTLDLISRESL